MKKVLFEMYIHLQEEYERGTLFVMFEFEF